MYNHSNEGTNLPFGFDEGDCERQSGCAYHRTEKRHTKEEKEHAMKLLSENKVHLDNPNIVSKIGFRTTEENLLKIINS